MRILGCEGGRNFWEGCDFWGVKEGCNFGVRGMVPFKMRGSKLTRPQETGRCLHPEFPRMCDGLEPFAILLHSGSSLALTFAGPHLAGPLAKKFFQICVLDSFGSGSYFNIRWILLIIASSKSDTWFVFKNKMLWQYSSFLRNTETKVFLWI